jgi:CheY-like chemotaxis protein
MRPIAKGTSKMAKLLMLDDDPQALEWTTAALSTRGHEVVGFTTARAALAALESWTPDLIVADILMPELDGLAFARIVRRHRNVPLMFISIAPRQAEAVLAGAVGYVQKPASATEIREAVDRVLGERARQNVVLVVDDDEEVRDLYCAVLEPRFTVATAENGKQALERIREARFDLAIVDVHMPIMNGLELIRAIRADPTLEKLPIIVQTSDRTAAQAPVWRTLRVSKVMDKSTFLDWFESNLRAASREASPPP